MRKSRISADSISSPSPDVLWWKPTELAQHWRCSTGKIISRIKAGEIRAMKNGAAYLISRDEIQRHESVVADPQPPERPVVTSKRKSALLANFGREMAEMQRKAGLHV